MVKRSITSTESPLRRSTRSSTTNYKDESSSEAEMETESPTKRVKLETESPKKKLKSSTKAVPAKSPKKVKKELESEDENSEKVSPTKKKAKAPADLAAAKLRKLTSFVASPYPDFKHPTPEECKKVVDLLSKLHGPAVRPKGKPIDDKSFGAACGQVPSIIDALVRTILSQNTTSKNSTAAKLNLDKTFGKGNWKAMHEASNADLEDAIRIGGLAPSKTLTIKNVLASALEEYGEFSLDHLHEESNDDAMRKLISFKGVGPKTASCVLLFCMARDSFAVDTHIFRLSKSLGWVPQKAGREETYGHLDIKIPAEYKYPLHALLITHGKRCGRCSAHRKSGLIPANECPLIGISKTKKEEGIKEEEDDEDDEEVVDGVKQEDDLPDDLKKTMAKIEDSAKQEERDEQGMAVE